MTDFLMTNEDLAKAKTAARAVAPLPAAGVKIWRLFHFATAAQTVNFANVPPVQVAGEFGMTDNPSGGVDGYYFF